MTSRSTPRDASRDDAVESLRRQIDKYERWVRLLDRQIHVLERERQKLSAVVNHSDAGFLVLDASLRVVWANDFAADLRRVGTGPQATVGATCNRVLCGCDATCETCAAWTSFRSRKVAHDEIRLEVDGRVRHLYVNAMPILSPAGEVDETMVMVQDVSDLKVLRSSQQALQQSEERFRSIFERAATGMATIGADGSFLQVNEAFCRFLGYPEAELLRRKIPDVTHPGDLEDFLRLFDDFLARERRTIDVEKRYLRRDGAVVWGRVTTAWLYDTAQRPIHAVALFQDVSERKRAEEALEESEGRLRQSQKMEAIGTLAGGVAHDFNNLLTCILGYAGILKKEAPNGMVSRAAETIEKAAQRGAALTQQLLGFARKGKNQNVPVDLEATIQEVIGLLERTLDKNILLARRAGLERAFVAGDPNQIQQVILNLAVNARDAMPEGGTLTFETRVVAFDERDCHTHAVPRPGPYVQLSITDTGCGIAEDLRSRIFEPFFTTKERGKGSGMGLAMVYGIVKNHGGSIEVQSTVGRGTTFSVHLPLTEDVLAGAFVSRREEIRYGSGRVLVVDDEEAVSNVARDLLSRLGYDVVTASDGLEAVAYYAKFGGEIDLVLLDLIMPRMGGRDCFRALKAINPEVKAILSTGYGFNIAAQELVDEGMIGFVPKPYLLAQLSEVVDRALKR